MKDLSASIIEKQEETDEFKFDRTDLITPVMFREYSVDSNGPLGWIRNKPGVALLSSAILPGSAQAVNGRWLRAGIYMAVEAAAVIGYATYRSRGFQGERDYEQFADENWSVAQYSNWIIEYHDYHGLTNPYLDELREMMEGIDPAFNTEIDWNNVDIETLNNAERQTPYITTDDLGANNFSHVLEPYGSQQYYELISKYFQYAPGWRDYYPHHSQEDTNLYLISRTGEKVSPMFWRGRDLAEEFNDDFRVSNNLLALLIVNHFISAFDAYFTVSLKNHRIEASTGSNPLQQIRLTYRF